MVQGGCETMTIESQMVKHRSLLHRRLCESRRLRAAMEERLERCLSLKTAQRNKGDNEEESAEEERESGIQCLHRCRDIFLESIPDTCKLAALTDAVRGRYDPPVETNIDNMEFESNMNNISTDPLRIESSLNNELSMVARENIITENVAEVFGDQLREMARERDPETLSSQNEQQKPLSRYKKKKAMLALLSLSRLKKENIGAVEVVKLRPRQKDVGDNVTGSCLSEINEGDNSNGGRSGIQSARNRYAEKGEKLPICVNYGKKKNTVASQMSTSFEVSKFASETQMPTLTATSRSQVLLDASSKNDEESIAKGNISRWNKKRNKSQNRDKCKPRSLPTSKKRKHIDSINNVTVVDERKRVEGNQGSEESISLKSNKQQNEVVVKCILQKRLNAPYQEGESGKVKEKVFGRGEIAIKVKSCVSANATTNYVTHDRMNKKKNPSSIKEITKFTVSSDRWREIEASQNDVRIIPEHQNSVIPRKFRQRSKSVSKIDHHYEECASLYDDSHDVTGSKELSKTHNNPQLLQTTSPTKIRDRSRSSRAGFTTPVAYRQHRQPRKCHDCKESTTNHRRCTFWFSTGTRCRKYYCMNCLIDIYGWRYDIEGKLDEDDWQCPSCLGRCTCESCTKERERKKARVVLDNETSMGRRRSSRRSNDIPAHLL